jgi:3-oxoacyl-[acyl-carrier-protein] synthase III
MTVPPYGLLGTGRALPVLVVHNADFPASLDTSDEWIVSRTGIRERHQVGPAETSVTLSIDAAKKALADAHLTASDLDLIVVATITPDTACPSTACRVQAALGCRAIPAFDVTAACSGFVYALGVAEQFHRSGTAKHSLTIGVDTLSRMMDRSDRTTCVLFGDGAGAAILGPSASSRLRSVNLFSDGTRGDLIRLPSGVPTDPNLKFVEMNGREVFRFAVVKLVEMLQAAVIEADALGLKIDLVIPHQVNIRIIEAAREQLGWPIERFYVNLDHTGNTSAASVPIALDEARQTGKAQPGQTLLLVAFGGGLTWSRALLTL